MAGLTACVHPRGDAEAEAGRYALGVGGVTGNAGPARGRLPLGPLGGVFDKVVVRTRQLDLRQAPYAGLAVALGAALIPDWVGRQRRLGVVAGDISGEIRSPLGERADPAGQPAAAVAVDTAGTRLSVEGGQIGCGCQAALEILNLRLGVTGGAEWVMLL